MTLSLFFARSAEGHTLIEGNIPSDLCRLTNDDARSMIDEKPFSDDRSRMDLNPRQEAPKVRDQARDQHPAAHKKCVGHTVQPDGMQPAVAEHHLGHALRRRVALKNDTNIAPDLCKHDRFLSSVNNIGCTDKFSNLSVRFYFIKKDRAVQPQENPRGENLRECFSTHQHHQYDQMPSSFRS